MSTTILNTPDTVVTAPKRHWPVLFVCFAVLIAIAGLTANTLRAHGTDHLRVFGSFWASGWAAAHGMNPYSAYPLTWVIRFNSHTVVVDTNLNPPTLLPFLRLLSRFNPDHAFVVWTMLSVLTFTGCAAVLMLKRQVQQRQIIWLLLCPATFGTITVAQDTAFLLVGILTAWLLLESDLQLSAGLVIGALVALKPNLGLWPVFLFFCGFRHTAIYAAVSCAVVSTLPLVLYGPKVYLEWLDAIRGDIHYVLPINLSLIALASSLGHATTGRVAALAIIVATCVVVIRRKPDAKIATGLALTLAILASPVGWLHYSLFLAPVLLSFRWGWKFTAIMAILMPHPYFLRFGPYLFIRCWYMLAIVLLWSYFVLESDHA